MTETIVATAVAVLYLLITVALVHRLVKHGHGLNKTILVLASYLALIGHAYLLNQDLFAGQALDMSFYTIFSLVAWFITLLIFAAAWREPVENLAIAILPLAAIAVVSRYVSQDTHYLSLQLSLGLQVHILVSILAYSLLTLAAVQAVLLSIQHAHLHNKHPAGFIRVLPPLETMERLMFRLIGLGFVILSVSLISGIPYIRDLFGQHLVHKTVLSVTAWVLFAILLWGRWQYGWRGRVAIRWTLSAFVVLMLAFFGSKFVSEIILQRP